MKQQLFILFFLTSLTGYTQQTGSFDVNIPFQSRQRQLSFHVPGNYDSSISYGLMICLHGSGGHSDAYRDMLVRSQWPQHLPGYILVCPDGGDDPVRSFYYPAGDEAIIDSSIAYATQHYHIDSMNMVLQGFSLGGRSALKYGLEHYNRFKGLLLNTPAIQCIRDAYEQVPNIPGGLFAYPNASEIPIYITHGTSDTYYQATVDSMYEQLVLNNGIARIFNIKGMGHAIPPITSSVMQGFIPFLNTPAPSVSDAELLKIIMPPKGCGNQVAAKCWIRNLGEDTLTSLQLEYKWGGSASTYTWKGALASFGQTQIALPLLTATPGMQTLKVTIKAVNGLPDVVTDNNEQTATFTFVVKGKSLPFQEGFESNDFPPKGWLQIKGGDVIQPWFRTTAIKKSGAASLACYNNLTAPNNKGRSEVLISPVLDLSASASSYLNFDVAYNYHRWKPPYASPAKDYADTLEIYLSTDCGATYQLLYKKGGTELTTFPEPIINPITINDGLFNPGADHWRTESIDLSDYATSEQAIVKFSYKSARGGTIFIDNVSFSNSPLDISEVSENDLELYPNPAHGQVALKTGFLLHDATLKLNNIMGRTLIRKTKINGTNCFFNIASLPPGIYVVELSEGNKVLRSKVVKE